MIKLFVGDVIKLKHRYYAGAIAIVVRAHRIESSRIPGDGGWISFDYIVMTDSDTLIHISDDCVKEIICR